MQHAFKNAALNISIILLLISFLASFSAAEIAGQWPMEEGSGQIVSDISGKNNDATRGEYTSSESIDPSWSTDSPVGDYSLDFDGYDDIAYVGNDDSLRTETVTVSAWVKPNDYTPNYNTWTRPDGSQDSVEATVMMSKWGEYKMAIFEDGTFVAAANSDSCGSGTWCYDSSDYDDYGGWAPSGFTVPKNQWTHVAFNWDGYKFEFYKNGNLEKTLYPDNANGYAPIDSGYSPVVIGSKYYDSSDPHYYEHFNGKIDNINVEDSATTPDPSDPGDGGGSDPGDGGGSDPGDGGGDDDPEPEPEPPEPEDFIISYWSMNDGSGQTVKDHESGNDGRRGTDSSIEPGIEPDWRDSGIDGHLEFDGDDSVHVPGDSSLNVNNEVTVSSWVRPDSDGGGTVFEKSEGYKMAVDENGELLASVRADCGSHSSWCGDAQNDGWVSSGVNVNAGEWSHVAFSWDGNEYTFYKDGNQEGTSNPSGSGGEVNNHNEGVSIGTGCSNMNNCNPENHFSGDIDEVCIFDGVFPEVNEDICGSDPGDPNDGGGDDGSNQPPNPDSSSNACPNNTIYGPDAIRWVPGEEVEKNPEAFEPDIEDELNEGEYGFCAGDDEDENIINQDCQSGFCSTNNSIRGVTNSPESCILDGGQIPIADQYNKRMAHSQGTIIKLQYENPQEIGCFDGKWFMEWPVSFDNSEMTVRLGETAYAPVTLVNIDDTAKEFEVSIRETDIKKFAWFTDNIFNEKRGVRDETKITVPPQGTETLSIGIYGGKNYETSKELKVEASSVDDDTYGEDEMHINIENASGQSSSEIPGLAAIQLAALMLASLLIYWRRL